MKEERPLTLFCIHKNIEEVRSRQNVIQRIKDGNQRISTTASVSRGRTVRNVPFKPGKIRALLEELLFQ
jgi:hypothetical protein